MRLKDIMSTQVESIGPGETLDRAARQMRLRGIHHLVVVSRGRFVGIVSEAALQTKTAEGVAKVEDAMFRHVATGAPEMTVARAARMMRGRPEGALAVFAGRKLAGIVTISDSAGCSCATRPAPPRARWQ